MTHKYVYVSFIGYISYIHTDHNIPQEYKTDDAAVIIGALLYAPIRRK